MLQGYALRRVGPARNTAQQQRQQQVSQLKSKCLLLSPLLQSRLTLVTVPTCLLLLLVCCCVCTCRPTARGRAAREPTVSPSNHPFPPSPLWNSLLERSTHLSEVFRVYEAESVHLVLNHHKAIKLLATWPVTSPRNLHPVVCACDGTYLLVRSVFTGLQPDQG
jgi:hypothetical protein